MSYRYFIQRQNAVANWMLDDTYPFQEYTGFGAAASKKSGTSDPTKSTGLVAGADYSTVFKSTSVGQFANTQFVQGQEQRTFIIGAWIYPIAKTTTGNQQILSHDGQYDGLSINGKVVRFGTAYLTTGTAYCDYDLQVYRGAYAIGIHTATRNELWINGELVSYVDITAAQQADSYVATDGSLYSGFTASTQELAINSVEFYGALSGQQIKDNYNAGIYVMDKGAIPAQYSGLYLNMDGAEANRYINTSWLTSEDFYKGTKSLVEYAPDQINPSFDVTTGLSVAGTWQVAVPLDAQADTSIYGAMVEWTGEGITVDTSLDGTTWAAATNGNLVAAVTSGYNPTNKDLRVRVNFPAGAANDGSVYLESLTINAYRSNAFNTGATRAVTVSWPAVLRENYQPILYRDDNGVNLHSQTLTIGTDSGGEVQVARTLEAWIKVISGTPTISVGGTKYRNGLADATLPVGEWSLIHYVAAADIATSITITGDVIVGQVVLYPTALSAADVAALYDSYTGYPTVRFSDSGTLAFSEPVTPVKTYDKDWSITPAG